MWESGLLTEILLLLRQERPAGCGAETSRCVSKLQEPWKKRWAIHEHTVTKTWSKPNGGRRKKASVGNLACPRESLQRQSQFGYGLAYILQELRLHLQNKTIRRPGFLDLLFPLDNRGSPFESWNAGVGELRDILKTCVKLSSLRCCRSPWTALCCHSSPRQLLPGKVNADWAQWHCYSLPWNVLVIFEGLFCFLTQEKYFRKLAKLLPPTYVGSALYSCYLFCTCSLLSLLQLEI